MFKTLASSVWAAPQNKADTEGKAVRSNSGSSLKGAMKRHDAYAAFLRSQPATSKPKAMRLLPVSGYLKDSGNRAHQVHVSFKPSRASSSAETADKEQKHWLDHARRYPSLVKIIGLNPEPIELSTAQQFLKHCMPSLYPKNDVALAPELFERRSYLESILMIPNPNDKLALVLEFWNRLGGLEETGNPVTALHFALTTPTKRRDDKTNSHDSDRMSIDTPASPQSSPPRPLSKVFDRKLTPFGTQSVRSKRKSSDNVIPGDHRADKRFRGSLSAAYRAGKENNDPDDVAALGAVPGLEADDGAEDVDETLPVRDPKYFLPYLAEQDAEARKYQGILLDEEVEAARAFGYHGAGNATDAWTGHFSRYGLM